jgi:L-seryl-tRNA(Ser) seleniumtransferase
MSPSDPVAAATEARKLPRADRLLEAAEQAGLVARLGHQPVMEAVRVELADRRAAVLAGAPCPPPAEIEAALLARLAATAPGALRRAINATGVIIHTNLGRAPLSTATAAAMAAAAEGYSTLEYDVERGERGDRYHHAAGALCRLTGAEDAVAVNNGAAAVLLALAALSSARPSSARLAAGEPGAPPGSESAEAPAEPRGPEVAEGPGLPEVIVSRGQLVEIGGGFRIPDVLRRSGAALVEVGTTNRTYLADVEQAITSRTRAVLSVHRSNFRLDGFVAEPTLAELVGLSRRRDLWVVDDLGSGALLPTAPWGLGAEPTVAERVRTGADLVCFSGDKLLGGPQAGLLVGRAAAVALVKRHPLLRALRLDKVALAGLSATLAHYERGEALRELPVWRAIARPLEALEATARRWLAGVAALAPGAEVRRGESAVGGGTLPGETLPTWLLALPSANPAALLASLRRAPTPVVARIGDGAVLLDPRTVLEGEEPALLAALRAALGGEGEAR